jgi:hypothetical protein
LSIQKYRYKNRSSQELALSSNSEFNKLSIESPLRNAQRYASAGPVNKKGQAFGLAFFVATRAHSFVSPCDGASQHLLGSFWKIVKAYIPK